MTRKLMFPIVTLATLLLSGCGESTEEISAKEKIIIIHDVSTAGCLLLENFGNDNLEKQDDVKNISYTDTNNNVSCSTYGKIKGEIDSYENIDASTDLECAEILLSEVQEALPEEDLSHFEDNDKACVLAFDVIQ
jgi:hypothetical protein